MTKYLKRLTALLLTFIMVLGIPISANDLEKEAQKG